MHWTDRRAAPRVIVSGWDLSGVDEDCPREVQALQPQHLVGFQIGEQLREPHRVVSDVEPTDQGGAVPLGAGNRVEQLAGCAFSKDVDDALAEGG
jgi:hypothetical protein